MSLVDILGLAVPVTYLSMYAVEVVRPARSFPKQRHWGIAGIGFLIVMMSVGVVAPMLLPVEWLDRHRLLDGTKLGVAGGVIVGLLVFQLFMYGFHRASHRSSFLWRVSHQMHHAPQRLDIPGAVVFHPVELALQNVLGIGTTVFVLGIEPLAAAIVGYVMAFLAFFQHWNVKTPRWLGYLIQRPESHCHHHELNVHAFNYADLPIWDIVFGTFKNPAEFSGQVGFEEKASYAKMLAGIDVNAAIPAERSGTPRQASTSRDLLSSPRPSRPGSSHDGELRPRSVA
jgi:sterol desaturase/sphingolipid hydroxylase (fatty acid hydroxylase superfamily)